MYWAPARSPQAPPPPPRPQTALPGPGPLSTDPCPLALELRPLALGPRPLAPDPRPLPPQSPPSTPGSQPSPPEPQPICYGPPCTRPGPLSTHPGPPLTPAHSPPCDTHLLSTMATPRSGTVSVVGSKRRRLQHASKHRSPCLLSSYFLYQDTYTRQRQTPPARPLQRLPSPHSPHEVCCTLRLFLYRRNPPVGQRPYWHPVQRDVPRLGRGALLFGIGRVVQPVLGDEELQELWDRNGWAVGARWRRDGRGREGPQGPTQTLDPVSSRPDPRPDKAYPKP